MRRWHAERELMLRRWREEIAKHEFPEYAYCALAPVPPVADESSCHCYRGMGVLRKRSPHDCGKARCEWCHYGKWLKKARGNELRQALEWEWRAE